MRRSIVGVLFCLAALPVDAAAQACLGAFNPDGSSTLEGVYTTTTGRKTYGARAIFNIPGQLSTFATYDIARFEDVNERGQKFGGGFALELRVPQVSMCSVSGGSYFRLRFEDEQGSELLLSQITIPFGIAIGKQLAATDGVAVILYGQPEFQYIRSKATFVDPDLGSETDTESQNQFGMHLGMRIGTDLFYGGAGAELTTIDDTDPIFSLVGAILVR